MNIYQKMSAITAEISAVAKNLNVGWGKASYKAVGEADVLAAVKPIEEKHGVYSYPCRREIVETAILTTLKQDGTESKQQFMRIATTYRFVNVEEPAEFIDVTTYGDGVDSQDKAPGKAMTYADKYALLKAYKIITGDDPDQFMSEDLAGKKSKERRTQKSGEQKKPVPGADVLNRLISEKGIESSFICGLYSVKEIGEMDARKVQNAIEHIDDIKRKQEEWKQ